MRKSSSYLLSISIVLSAIALTGCPTPPDDLDGFITFQMEQGRIPGIAAGIIVGNQLVWTQNYGWANIEENRPPTSDTLFQLASISKTVTGTAIMQLEEHGQLDIDADINTYLPFPIRNPHHPNAPITLRMLLTHRSSLRDNNQDLVTLYAYGSDSPISLHDLIQGMFTPDGQWYNAYKCFYTYAPDGEYNYSNLGFALIGYIVECVAGIPFDQYCNDNLFAPLGMDETRWFLRDLDPTHIAMPYQDRGIFAPHYVPYGQYGYPDYPDGQLRTSVNQFARFIIAIMNNGQYNETSILTPETTAEMLRIQNPEADPYQALAWRHFPVADGGHTVIGHGGGEQGVLTEILFDPELGIGTILLTNGDAASGRLDTSRLLTAFQAIQNRIYQEAINLSASNNAQ